MQSLKKIHAWAQMQVPLYTTNVEMHSLLHDIPRFFILFLEELFLIFNQMLSIRAFGRRATWIFVLIGSQLILT